MPDFDHIIYEKANGRARITLNRPEKMNALSMQLMVELNEALWEADCDRDVHAVILKGAGRCFSAGYDLTGADAYVPASRITDQDNNRYRGNASLDDDTWNLERAQRYRMALFDMHKPVIAQVHGHCLAGGTDLALLCDMIIASEDAEFGFPPARDLGALPNNMWVYNCGAQWAKRITMTGDVVNGKDAQQIGLIMKAVPAALLEDEVEGLVDRLAKIDPDLLSVNKRIINLGMELMGARALQRLACENDMRGHNARGAREFAALMREEGVQAALRVRREKFPDGRIRVNGPEIRDESGRLVDWDPPDTQSGGPKP
ncbi:MAG: crotonase/enoyl-CoA hydratase family protein [Gammaproteobacteria bacterium]|nr:crotonase/enoyl-CoA hydratase family protein [Gammaproteobacteria bacterium]MYE52838.1 crotonase/enoyl-CoA hydratase family protein [Gammaproteobacteria bacterium]